MLGSALLHPTYEYGEYLEREARFGVEDILRQRTDQHPKSRNLILPNHGLSVSIHDRP
jgi:hypothetical protein